MLNFDKITPYPFLSHYRDPLGVCFTIIKGSDLSVVIDCGYGIYNTREFIEKEISTPYLVFNTHGHMDHTGGDYLFDEVYITKEDYDLLIKHNSIAKRSENLSRAKKAGILSDDYNFDAYINAPLPKVHFYKSGDIFDLGNLTLKIIPMPGHTQGSVGILVEEAKLLITGDAAIHNIWLFLEESTTRPPYIKMLENIRKLDFDYFITGHLMNVFPKRFIDYYIEVAREASVENSKPISFEGFERKNCYQYLKTFENTTIGICYQEPKE